MMLRRGTWLASNKVSLDIPLRSLNSHSFTLWNIDFTHTLNPNPIRRSALRLLKLNWTKTRRHSYRERESETERWKNLLIKSDSDNEISTPHRFELEIDMKASNVCFSMSINDISFISFNYIFSSPFVDVHVDVESSLFSHCGMGREPSFFKSFTNAVLWLW